MEDPANPVVTMLSGVISPLLTEMVGPSVTDDMLEGLLEGIKKVRFLCEEFFGVQYC